MPASQMSPALSMPTTLWSKSHILHLPLWIPVSTLRISTFCLDKYHWEDITARANMMRKEKVQCFERCSNTSSCFQSYSWFSAMRFFHHTGAATGQSTIHHQAAVMLQIIYAAVCRYAGHDAHWSPTILPLQTTVCSTSNTLGATSTYAQVLSFSFR